MSESGIRCRPDWRHGRPVLQHERRRDVVERSLRHILQERKARRRERRRDPRHLDPDLSVSGTDDGFIRHTIDGANARAKVVLLQRPNRFRARIFELPRLGIEDGGLTVDFRGREIEGVAKSRVDGQAIRHLPVVLNEVLLEVRALLDVGLLKIDGKGLHLSEQEARERVAGARNAGQIAADGAEGKRSRRPWWLDHVQPLPSPVEPRLHGVAAFEPGERIGDLRDAGTEVRRRVVRRSELLIAIRRERRHRAGELRIRRDAGNVERGSRRRRQRHRATLD